MVVFINLINYLELRYRPWRISLARSSKGSVPQIAAATLAAGDYYLRVRSPKNKINYSVSISSPTVVSVIPSPVLPTGITTSLFSGTGLPKAQGWLDFNQIPTFFPINQPPFLSNTAKTVVQTPSATGVMFKTDEGIATITDLNKGYAGYSNYTVTPTLKLAKVNAAFPKLDRTTGYSLSFKLAVTSEVSNPDRAGFSIILNSEDAKGIELGFKSDRIFAQSSTFTEDKKAIFTTNALTDYKLAVKGDDYELFANNASILKGALQTYQFDPATSNPPLPASPYALPSFLFLGDNTDQGRASVTLGAIAITQG